VATNCPVACLLASCDYVHCGRLLGGVAVPCLQSRYDSLTNTPVTPFRVLGLYHLARQLPPIVQHMQGMTTDHEFLLAMSAHELGAQLFFAPWLAMKVLKLVWPHRWSFAAALFSSIAVFAALPARIDSGKWTIKLKVLFWLQQ
jgi:hypothetical protein